MAKRKQRRDEELFKMVIQRIKSLRETHHYTQEYVNEYTGLDIPHLETGRDFPSLTTIAILCKFYNITIVEFFSPIDYPAKE